MTGVAFAPDGLHLASASEDKTVRVWKTGGAAPVTVAYFVSFILLGTMIVLNLLIGVIVSGMEEARQDMEDETRKRHVEATGAASVGDDVVALRRQVDSLQDSLAALQRRLK